MAHGHAEGAKKLILDPPLIYIAPGASWWRTKDVGEHFLDHDSISHP